MAGETAQTPTNKSASAPASTSKKLTYALMGLSFALIIGGIALIGVLYSGKLIMELQLLQQSQM